MCFHLFISIMFYQNNVQAQAHEQSSTQTLQIAAVVQRVQSFCLSPSGQATRAETPAEQNFLTPALN